METVGVRELKNHLSRHLKRVRSGGRLIVTERGRAVAEIRSVDMPTNKEWADEMVRAGLAHWNGRKPTGSLHPIKAVGWTLSSAVLEDRR